MFEFHGWFVIKETLEDRFEDNTTQIISDLRSLLNPLEWASGAFDLKPFNGMYCLNITGHANRPRRYHQDIDQLLNFLAQKTPGSYGLLYWRDDEDDSSPGRTNFHVRVLARGTIVDRFDPFLSPAVPTIEEP